MTPDKMQATLQQLHDELSRTPQVDGEGRKLLEQLAHDIQRVLGEQAASSVPTRTVHLDELESAAVRFDVEHPTLASVIRQVAEALGRVGL